MRFGIWVLLITILSQYLAEVAHAEICVGTDSKCGAATPVDPPPGVSPGGINVNAPLAPPNADNAPIAPPMGDPPDDLKKYDSKFAIDCERIKNVPKGVYAGYMQSAIRVCENHRNSEYIKVKLPDGVTISGREMTMKAFDVGCLGSYTILFRRAANLCRIMNEPGHNKTPPNLPQKADAQSQRAHFILLARKNMVDVHRLQRIGQIFRETPRVIDELVLKAINSAKYDYLNPNVKKMRARIDERIKVAQEGISSASLSPRAKEIQANSVSSLFQKAKDELESELKLVNDDYVKLRNAVRLVEGRHFDKFGYDLLVNAQELSKNALELCGRAQQIESATPEASTIADCENFKSSINATTGLIRLEETNFTIQGLPVAVGADVGPESNLTPDQRNYNDLIGLETDIRNMGVFGPDAETRELLKSWTEVDHNGVPVLSQDQLREKVRRAVALVRAHDGTNTEWSRGTAFLMKYPVTGANGEVEYKEVWTSAAHVFELEGAEKRMFTLFSPMNDDGEYGLRISSLTDVAGATQFLKEKPELAGFTEADVAQLLKVNPEVGSFLMTKENEGMIYDEFLPYNATGTRSDLAILDPDKTPVMGLTGVKVEPLEIRDMANDPIRDGEKLYCSGYAGEFGTDLQLFPCNYEGFSNVDSVAISAPNVAVSRGGISGGPVVDSGGRVVCVNSWSYRQYSVSGTSDTHVAGCAPLYMHKGTNGQVTVRPYPPAGGQPYNSQTGYGWDEKTNSFILPCRSIASTKGTYETGKPCSIRYVNGKPVIND